MTQARGSATTAVRTAIVLGAGGTVGIAYHAGVAKALADAGIDPAAADLVVGTSAGAIVGSIVRVGHDLDDVWALAHADENPFVEDEPFFRPDVVFSQGWRTPVGLARRMVGSAYVLQRSVVRWPVMNPPRPMQRFYRAGLGSVTEQRAEFANWAGEDWPDGHLALCTFDIVTGRRVVLGAPSPSRPALPDAMRAASAVPMLYPPVRLGRRLLIDGAVSSSTNVDVAVEAGAELIVVAAPQSYEPDDAPAAAPACLQGAVPPPARVRAARGRARRGEGPGDPTRRRGVPGPRAQPAARRRPQRGGRAVAPTAPPGRWHRPRVARSAAAWRAVARGSVA